MPQKIALSRPRRGRYRRFTLDGAPDFLEYMIEADRSLTALYALNSGSDARAIRDAVDDAALVYEALLAVQRARAPDQEHYIRLQMAVDLLQTKLRSFGRVC
jgi:hypothetical protein